MTDIFLVGETIPIRLFLGGFDLTPTFRDVNKKYSTRYYLSLVLIDEGKKAPYTFFVIASSLVLSAGAQFLVRMRDVLRGCNAFAWSRYETRTALWTALSAICKSRPPCAMPEQCGGFNHQSLLRKNSCGFAGPILHHLRLRHK